LLTRDPKNQIEAEAKAPNHSLISAP